MFCSCRSGQENLRYMTKTTFDGQTDYSGRENVYQVSDELNKNNHESAGQDAIINKARMYPRPGNSIYVQC